MKTKRHAAALGMLVVLLIAGSGYVHLANASAQEQALAYGGSIEPLLSAADHLRAFFMDRDFLLAYGMSVPNVNGMCILILFQALLLISWKITGTARCHPTACGNTGRADHDLSYLISRRRSFL